MAEQVRALFSRGLLPICTSPLNGCILVYFSWGRLSPATLVGWWSAVAAIAAFRVALHRAYWLRRPSAEEAPAWARRFAFGALLAGCGWGATALVLFPGWGLVGQVLGMFVVGGMCAGSAAFSASYPPAFYGFMLSATLPWVARLLSEGGRLHLSMALMALLFSLALAKIGRGGFRMFVASATLQHQNTSLVEELSQARQNLTALNHSLERRIEERTRELQAALSSLQAAERAAQQAVWARDEFLAVASHELSTPLLAFRLQFELLEREIKNSGATASKEVSSRLDNLSRQVSRFVTLVDTVLDVARLGIGRLQLSPREVNFSQLLTELLASLKEELSSKSCPVIEEIEEGVVGSWDPVRLEQVVVNLISNAAKYGSGKPIHVALSARGEEVVLVVKDRGIGISQQDVDVIFGKYQRAVGSTSPYSGLGLGLYVVRQLVEAMSGVIAVQSRPGEGSAFTLVLPLRSKARASAVGS